MPKVSPGIFEGFIAEQQGQRWNVNEKTAVAIYQIQIMLTLDLPYGKTVETELRM